MYTTISGNKSNISGLIAHHTYTNEHQQLKNMSRLNASSAIRSITPIDPIEEDNELTGI